MKLSFTTLATPHVTGVEAIRLARRYGFQGIDLRVSEQSGELTLAATKHQMTEIRTAMHDEGIRIASLMAYNQTGNENQSSWAVMRESVRRHIELAGCVEADHVRIGLGKKPEQLSTDYWLKHIAETLFGCLEEAASTNVTLLIQNHYNQLTALQCSKLIKQINHKQLALLLSTDHVLIQHEHVESVLQEASGITKQLYIADIVRKATDYDDVLPGEGEAPLLDFYEGIGGSRYDGWITLKWEKLWRPALAHYEVIFPFFINYINRKLMHTREEEE